jgi:hypothetical protein
MAGFEVTIEVHLTYLPDTPPISGGRSGVNSPGFQRTRGLEYLGRRVFGLGARSTKFNQCDYRFPFTPNYGPRTR